LTFCCRRRTSESPSMSVQGENRKTFARTEFFSVLPIAEVVGFRASAINLRIDPGHLWMPDDYLRAIEPLIAIVLGCMRWKSAQAHEVRRCKRMIDEQRR
jgi:hypothetical protein